MKTRSDSKIDKLAPEQQALLKQWLCVEKASLLDVVKRCQQQFGLATSVSRLSAWLARQEKNSLADRALKFALDKASESAASATGMVRALEDLKDPFWAALMGQIGQDAFERRMAQVETPSVETLKDLVEIASFGLKAKHDSAKLRQADEKLSQSREKLKLELRKYEERESATRKAVSDGSLSAEEKESAVKQILGIT